MGYYFTFIYCVCVGGVLLNKEELRLLSIAGAINILATGAVLIFVMVLLYLWINKYAGVC